MLEANTTFKNYKQLCSHLNEPIHQGGLAKINQLSRWQESFRWTKSGHKFIITTVIKPLEQREHMKLRKSKWYHSAAKILLNRVVTLIEEGNTGSKSYKYNELILTTNEGYNLIGLCNSKFGVIKTLDNHEVDLNTRRDFHKEVSHKFYEVFNNLLYTLRRYNILDWDRTYRYTLGSDPTIIIADLEQRTFIQTVTRETLEEFGLKTTWQVMEFNKEEPFYRKLNIRLEDFSIFNCLAVYQIGFSSTCLPSFQTYVDSLEELQTAKLDINSKSIAHVEDLIAQGRLLTESLETLPFELLLEFTIPLEKI